MISGGFVTSCLDGKIRIWRYEKGLVSLAKEEKDPVNRKRETPDKIKNGLLGMTASKTMEGVFLSWSFSSRVTIWNCHTSVVKSYVGSFEPNSEPVVLCKTCRGASFCITAYKGNVIRIWDYKSLETVQLISGENTILTSMNVLHVLPNDDFFLVNKEFYLFRHKEVESQKKIKGKISEPVEVAVNTYHKTLICTSSEEIRFYDIQSGTLKEMILNPCPKERGFQPLISAFAHGALMRKFYLGFNSGVIYMYNTKDAECIKAGNQLDADIRSIKKIEETTLSPSDWASSSQDVTCLLYLPDEKVLIAGTAGGAIKFFDEDHSEESDLIKIYIGGHGDSEISSLSYNKQTRMLVSGSAGGVAAVWSISTNKLEHICCGHQSKIIGTAILFPYPVLLVCADDGSISMWSMNFSGSFDQRNEILMRFFCFEHNNMGTRLEKLQSLTSFHYMRHEGTSIISTPMSLYKKDEPQTQLVQDKVMEGHLISLMRAHDSKSSQNGSPPQQLSFLQMKQEAWESWKSSKPDRSPRTSRSGEKTTQTVLPGPLAATSVSWLTSFYNNPNLDIVTLLSPSEFEKTQRFRFPTGEPELSHQYVFLGTAGGDVLVLDLLPAVLLLGIEKINNLKLTEMLKKDNTRKPENLSVHKQASKAIELARRGIKTVCEVHDVRASVLVMEVNPDHRKSVKMPLPPTPAEPPGAPGTIFSFLDPHAPKPHIEPLQWKKQPITSVSYHKELSPPSLVMCTPVSVCILPLQKHPGCSHIELKENVRLTWGCRFNWANEIIDDYSRVWNIAKALGGLNGISGEQTEFVAKKLSEVAGFGDFSNGDKKRIAILDAQSVKTRGILAAMGGFQTAAAVHQSAISNPFAAPDTFKRISTFSSGKNMSGDFLKNLKQKTRGVSSKLSESKSNPHAKKSIMNRMDSLLLPSDGNSNFHRLESSTSKGIPKDKSEHSLRIKVNPTSDNFVRGELVQKIEQRMTSYDKELELARAASKKAALMMMPADSSTSSPLGRLNRKFKAVSNVLKMTHLLNRGTPKIPVMSAEQDSTFIKQSSLRSKIEHQDKSIKPILKRSFTSKLDVAVKDPSSESPTSRKPDHQTTPFVPPAKPKQLEVNPQPAVEAKPHRTPQQPHSTKHSRTSSLQPPLVDYSIRAEQKMTSFLLSLRNKPPQKHFLIGGSGRALVNRPTSGTPVANSDSVLTSREHNLPEINSSMRGPSPARPVPRPDPTALELASPSHIPQMSGHNIVDHSQINFVSDSKIGISFSNSARVVMAPTKRPRIGSQLSLATHRSSKSLAK